MTGKYLEPKSWTAWTENDVRMLKDLWQAKNSASMIAEELTRATGRDFTRNSIIGKIHRLGLQGQGQLAPKFTKSKKRKPREKKLSTIIAGATREDVMQELASEAQAMFPEIYACEDVPTQLTGPNGEAVDKIFSDLSARTPNIYGIDLPNSNRVTISDLRPGICKYPIGDPLAADFTFCGNACGGPYCEAHHKIAYVPVTKWKQPARRGHR